MDEKIETIDKDGKEVNALEAMTNQSLRLTVKNSSNLQNYDTREYAILIWREESKFNKGMAPDRYKNWTILQSLLGLNPLFLNGRDVNQALNLRNLQNV